MKKIYFICGLAIFLGISAGISFFLIRDANAQIPGDIELIDHNSDRYHFGKDKTKLKLIEFIYTQCPDICPTTTIKMVDLEKDLENAGVFGKDIEFITITIDPYRDTPEVLTKYMKDFGVKNTDSWLFLTGKTQNSKQEAQKIRKIADSLQFQYKDPGNGQFIHTTFTYLVDENNKFIRKFPMGKGFNKKEVYETIMSEIK